MYITARSSFCRTGNCGSSLLSSMFFFLHVFIYVRLLFWLLSVRIYSILSCRNLYYHGSLLYWHPDEWLQVVAQLPGWTRLRLDLEIGPKSRNVKGMLIRKTQSFADNKLPSVCGTYPKAKNELWRTRRCRSSHSHCRTRSLWSLWASVISSESDTPKTAEVSEEEEMDWSALLLLQVSCTPRVGKLSVWMK